MAIDFHEIGRQAHAADEPSAPWLSAAVRAAVGTMAVGTGAADIMRAYSAGWHAANAAAPVVGVCTIDGVSPCPMHDGAVHVPTAATLAQCLALGRDAAMRPRVPLSPVAAGLIAECADGTVSALFDPFAVCEE